MGVTEKNHVAWLVDRLVGEALCSYNELREALEQKGLYELQYLAVEHENPLVRLRAVLLLAALGGTCSMEILARLAEEDEDEIVRVGAEEELKRW